MYNIGLSIINGVGLTFLNRCYTACNPVTNCMYIIKYICFYCFIYLETMATNLISAEVSAEKNKFQEMRENLNQKFSELTSLVNQRKLELDRKIDDLEIEYNNKNKQIEKDKQTMRELREMTEEKIDQNTLMDVQNNLIEDISDKIQKLDVESKSQLELTLTLNWNFTKIIQEIDRIDLKLATPNEPRIPFVLTEVEKKRHINDLKSKIYIFLMGKGSPVPLAEFEHQYRAVNREDPEIAYRVLGYATLKEFLREIRDILQFRIEDKDGSTSVTVKTKKPSPPSLEEPLRSYVNNSLPFMPPSNSVRPFPSQIHPVYRTTPPNSGFINSNQNVPRFPTHTHTPYPRPPIPGKQSYLNIPNEPQIPFPLRADPPRFEANINPSIIPLSPLSDPLLGPFPLDGLRTNLTSLSLRPETTPLKPFYPSSHTTLHSLNMDFSKAQRDFLQTQIVSIAGTRSEVKLRFSCESVLRFLEGNNVVLLAGEDQGKCALVSVALTNGLNIMTNDLQSLVICQDAKGAQKIFQCLEILSNNTGLKVSCYDSPEKFRSVRTEAHIIVLIHTLIGEFFTQYDTTQLTRIGLYNLITDLNTYYEVVRILKLNMSGKLSELKFFFATTAHNEVGTFILKLINTLMVSKCIFSFYGKDQETCLTLLPHDVESNQIQNGSDADIRPHLLASLTRARTFPNLFDKFLIPLGASCNNFTIISTRMEEELLLQSLALIAMNKVEPSTATTQVAIVVPNEQQAKDFLELCELGQVAGVKSLMVNGKTIKEEMRYTHMCIGW